ncbi:MAG TPA: hypothetical protein VIR45_00015 [Kiloniellaceae bacterium]
MATLEKRVLPQGSKKGRLGAAPGCSDRNAGAEPPDDLKQRRAVCGHEQPGDATPPARALSIERQV